MSNTDNGYIKNHSNEDKFYILARNIINHPEKEIQVKNGKIDTIQINDGWLIEYRIHDKQIFLEFYENYIIGGDFKYFVDFNDKETLKLMDELISILKNMLFCTKDDLLKDLIK